MTEENQAKKERTDEEQIQAAGQSKPKQSVSGSTLESSPAHLSVRKTVQVNYQPSPPPAHEEPPEEPPKKVPVVPPGDYEEDADDSPPVHFDDPEQDDDSADEPANEKSTGK